MVWNAMHMDELPWIGEVINIHLAKFITFDANYCVYSDYVHDLMVNLVHPLFLKSKYPDSKEDNPNRWQAINGTFSYKYCMSGCKNIQSSELMEAWEVVDITEEMNAIDSTWYFKLEQFPGGLFKNFKWFLCAQVDH